ncbi:ABC transporter permease [Pseudoalteromonas denitrificans]|uniref:Putative ABC transport system permease protein n=1 Tax=Pseudoalteromonas denitrificans DSM 6059 TaxID=1123010 RepID=A0A1I1G2Y8_9GAMM|nr:ABC transporter permease [Pseudoalteromonas denitrificans]SFC05881.1 putative ABC transport system permease protein [Pseudoalteromonas denitrificans DSM 6059]
MEMLIYYIKLSIHNIKRHTLFFTLMITTLALGIAVLLANLAILKVMSSDPIPQKSDKIFSVNMTTWPETKGDNSEPLHILRYRDAMHILKSDIPTYSLIHYESNVYTRAVESKSLSRFGATTRATTQAFFQLTNAPFEYGQSWENENAFEVVIGADLNQKLFGGINSVGKNIEIDNKLFRIVGVLKPWHLKPLFYHASERRAFNKTDDLFAPIEVALDNSWGIGARASSTEMYNASSETREKNVFYLQAFVQLDTQQQKTEFQNYLDSYSQSLKDAGEHPFDINNKLYNVNEWLTKNKVVDDKILAFALATLLFLAVCIFNASSLLLARYHSAKFETGLRRAIGASKKQIFLQGSIESIIIGTICAFFSIVIGWIFLKLSLSLFPYLTDIANFDMQLMIMGICIAIATSFISALYPLIRASNSNISSEIK